MLDRLFVREKDYHEYTKKAFHFFAPFYWFFELFMKGLKRKMIRMSEVTAEDKVVDFCCGTGTLALGLSKVTPNVVGIDLSSDMLKMARERDKENKAKFVEMDASKTSFDDNEFDIGFISVALHDMPHDVRHDVLEELKRVTKRRIVIAEYSIPRNWLLKRLYTNLISLYESKYFRDFVRRDFRELLREHSLRIINEDYATWHLLKIFVCEFNNKFVTNRIK